MNTLFYSYKPLLYIIEVYVSRYIHYMYIYIYVCVCVCMYVIYGYIIIDLCKVGISLDTLLQKQFFLTLQVICCEGVLASFCVFSFVLAKNVFLLMYFSDNVYSHLWYLKIYTKYVNMQSGLKIDFELNSLRTFFWYTKNTNFKIYEGENEMEGDKKTRPLFGRLRRGRSNVSNHQSISVTSD